MRYYFRRFGNFPQNWFKAASYCVLEVGEYAFHIDVAPNKNTYCIEPNTTYEVRVAANNAPTQFVYIEKVGRIDAKHAFTLEIKGRYISKLEAFALVM